MDTWKQIKLHQYKQILIIGLVNLNKGLEKRASSW